MNNLVNSEYDSFEKKTKVKLKEFIRPLIVDNTLELQDVGVMLGAQKEEGNTPETFLFIGYQAKELHVSELLIKINDKELYRYGQIVESGSSIICMIPIMDFEKLCEAQTIEIRLKNEEGHTDFSSEAIKFGACAIYNAIIDENAYLDDIQKGERERADKQQKIEREKLSQIEKFNQRIERIKKNGVNKYFSVDYDKFKQKLTVDIKDAVEFKQIEGTMLILEPKIGFRFVYTNEESSILLIDFEAVSKRGLNLKNGELLLLIDETKRLSLAPHENYSESHLQEFHIESDWYAITEDELKLLCDARNIEMRITNGDEYHDLTTDGLQLAARRFYNAVIDDTTYIDDLQTQEEREAAERERQQQEYYAEQERLRQERLAKEAEEERIRAEKRAAWWAANKRKVGIAILILIGIIVSIVTVKKISNAIAAKHAITEAYEMIEQGKELVSTYHFDEAKDLYDQAYRMTMDKEVRNAVQEQNSELTKARQIADVEYNKALKRLKILLDADDNEFNQYSNECLDKMIEIYPNRQETIYYKELRGK